MATARAYRGPVRSLALVRARIQHGREKGRRSNRPVVAQKFGGAEGVRGGGGRLHGRCPVMSLEIAVYQCWAQSRPYAAASGRPPRFRQCHTEVGLTKRCRPWLRRPKFPSGNSSNGAVGPAEGAFARLSYHHRQIALRKVISITFRKLFVENRRLDVLARSSDKRFMTERPGAAPICICGIIIG